MYYNELLPTLENLTGEKIYKKDLADVIKMSRETFSRKINAKEQEIVPFEKIKLIENFYNVTLSTDFISIPYYKDIMASCGNGNLMLDNEPDAECYPISIKYGLNPNNKYFLINATGDSMEKTIFDKELVILENWLNRQIVDDKIYFFSYNKEYYLKRLSKNIDTIQISSDNKILNDLGELKYPDKILKGEDLNNIIIYGRFKGKIEKDL